MVLEEEITQYEKDLPDILKNHENEFVVYKGKDRLGFYGDYQGALKAGYNRCGNDRFFVKKVLKEYITQEEIDEFWKRVEHAAAEIKTWPKWKIEMSRRAA